VSDKANHSLNVKDGNANVFAGNWSEDRAPEMAHGVFPDYGFVSGVAR
jgi:hypothetical protein